VWAVGNLLLAALSELKGDFLEAVHAAARLLKSRGHVLPSTLEPVHLVAHLEDGAVLVGEQRIVRSGRRIARVSLSPSAPPPTRGVLEALQQARLITLGPGSLYSSLMPNLLVEGVAQALASSRALKVLVLNLMTQPGETDGMSGAEHVRAVLEHAGPVIDAVLFNTRAPEPGALQRYREQGSQLVQGEPQGLARMGLRPVGADLLSAGPWIRHPPLKVARSLIHLLREHPSR
jgi:uncharacterized cofD-like protein